MLLSLLASASRGLRRGLRAWLVLLLVMMTAIAALDTLAWGLFERSWAEAGELTGLLLGWFALFGAALGVAEGQHIAVDMVIRRLPAGPQAALAHLANGLVALFGLLLAAFGGQLTAAIRNTLPATGLPAALQYVPLGLAGALIAFFAFEQLLTKRPGGHDD